MRDLPVTFASSLLLDTLGIGVNVTSFRKVTGETIFGGGTSFSDGSVIAVVCFVGTSHWSINISLMRHETTNGTSNGAVMSSSAVDPLCLLMTSWVLGWSGRTEYSLFTISEGQDSTKSVRKGVACAFDTSLRSLEVIQGERQYRSEMMLKVVKGQTGQSGSPSSRDQVTCPSFEAESMAIREANKARWVDLPALNNKSHFYSLSTDVMKEKEATGGVVEIGFCTSSCCGILSWGLFVRSAVSQSCWSGVLL